MNSNIDKVNKKKAALYGFLYLWKISKQSRRFWVHPINIRRKKHGEYFTIVKLLQSYPEKYFTYFRMSKEMFEKILVVVRNSIRPSKRTTRRDTISAREKLVITLRYVVIICSRIENTIFNFRRFLASGSSFTELSLRFLMGRSTIEKCIYQTIKAINSKMIEIALP